MTARIYVFNKKDSDTLKSAAKILKRTKPCKKYGGIFCFNCTAHRLGEDIKAFVD